MEEKINIAQRMSAIVCLVMWKIPKCI